MGHREDESVWGWWQDVVVREKCVTGLCAGCACACSNKFCSTFYFSNWLYGYCTRVLYPGMSIVKLVGPAFVHRSRKRSRKIVYRVGVRVSGWKGVVVRKWWIMVVQAAVYGCRDGLTVVGRRPVSGL